MINIPIYINLWGIFFVFTVQIGRIVGGVVGGTIGIVLIVIIVIVIVIFVVSFLKITAIMVVPAQLKTVASVRLCIACTCTYVLNLLWH